MQDGSEADLFQPAARRGGFSATVGIAGPKALKPEKPPQKYAPWYSSRSVLVFPFRFVSTRRQYGRGEDVYIMDAKSIGNIGRYLNHSCNPNVFVQNVFVDTHDLRFPWIAFFTSTYVRAGGELCWDYNYEVIICIFLRDFYPIFVQGWLNPRKGVVLLMRVRILQRKIALKQLIVDFIFCWTCRYELELITINKLI